MATATRNLSRLFIGIVLICMCYITINYQLPLYVSTTFLGLPYIVNLILKTIFNVRREDFSQKAIPFHSEYVLTRFGEFEILLLGEGVLQTILIPLKTHPLHYTMLALSLIILMLVRYAIFEFESFDPVKHASAHSKRGYATILSNVVKSVIANPSILCISIGLKELLVFPTFDIKYYKTDYDDSYSNSDNDDLYNTTDKSYSDGDDHHHLMFRFLYDSTHRLLAGKKDYTEEEIRQIIYEFSWLLGIGCFITIFMLQNAYEIHRYSYYRKFRSFYKYFIQFIIAVLFLLWPIAIYSIYPYGLELLVIFTLILSITWFFINEDFYHLDEIKTNFKLEVFKTKREKLLKLNGVM